MLGDHVALVEKFAQLLSLNIAIRPNSLFESEAPGASCLLVSSNKFI